MVLRHPAALCSRAGDARPPADASTGPGPRRPARFRARPARPRRAGSVGAQRLSGRPRSQLPRGERRPAASRRRAHGLGAGEVPGSAEGAARVPGGAPWRAGRCRRRCEAPGLRSSRRLAGRGPGGRWKGRGVKARLEVEPNFAAGGAEGDDACAPGARAAELTAQLWAVSPEEAPPPRPHPARPPRQRQPHRRAHQRTIAARDISADTGPARGRGWEGRRASTAAGRVDLPVLAPRPPPAAGSASPAGSLRLPGSPGATPAGRCERERAPPRAGTPVP